VVSNTTVDSLFLTNVAELTQ